MKVKLSKRVKAIKPSATLALTAKAKEMQAKGIDVISFGAGEPDFDTPENIKRAGVEAIEEGFTKYCPVDGTPSLKKAVLERIKEDFAVDYSPPEVIVTPGAKMAIFEALYALLDDQDEVLIPAPYWVSYPDMVLLAGGTPKIIETKEEDGFSLKPEDVEKAITEKTKVLILNSPCNPTGAVISKEDLKGIAEIAIAKDILVIADEIYAKIIFESKFISFPSLDPRLKERTILIYGVSKTYSMTGWRIGFALGPADIISAMRKVQSQTTSNPTSISLKAAEEAVKGDQEEVERMVLEFRGRRDLIWEGLMSIKGISCFKPQGAFYIFPNFSNYMKGDINSSIALSEYLLEKAKVAVVPGSAFGAEGYARLSFATSERNIKEGLDRIKESLESL